MATVLKMFKLCPGKGLRKALQTIPVASDLRVGVANQERFYWTARGLSNIPNSLRRRTGELSSHRENFNLRFALPSVGDSFLNSSYKASDTSNSVLQVRQASTEATEQAETSSGKSEDKKEKDKWYSGKNAWKIGLISLTAMGVMMGGNILFMWGAPLYDKDGNEIPDEFTILPKWQAYPRRALKETFIFWEMIQEPSSKKLLPDPVKEPYYQPPYTLVIELTGVLVHPDWTLNTGWRFKKRPAVDYFLQQVAPPLFEVVIYTHEQGFTAFPIIDGLDQQNQSIMFRLFRDATRYQDGVHMKDLGCLNRDLSKVIMIDCDPKAVSLQPRNAVSMDKWAGNDDDRKLVDLAAFLRTIASSGVDDVRTVLDHYNQYDDPLQAFKENQQRLQEEQEKRAKTAADEQKRSLASSFSFGLGRKR